METNFGTISYGAASVAFLLLTALLLGRWRGESAGGRLIAAAGATAVWGFVLAWAAARELPPLVIYTTETLHLGIWLVALMGIGAGVVPRGLAIAGNLGWLGMLAAGILVPVAMLGAPTGAAFGSLMARGGLLCALLGLVMLEQIYRNSEPQGRSTLKWIVAGIGMLLAYDLFLFAQAELLRGISEDAWNARGLVYALAVPIITIAIKRNPQWTLDIFVSRHVVFYSTTFLVVGAGLFLMALGGYYVRAISGTWGAVGQILFWSIGSVLLLALLGAESFRRRLRVFISKHFYRNKYDYRLEWLRFIRTLSSTDEVDVRRTAIRAVTQILGSPGGALLLLDESGRRYQPIATWPMDIGAMPGLSDLKSDDELVAFLAKKQWIVDLEEHRRSPEVYRSIDLPGWVRADPTLRIIVPMLELDRLVGIFVLYGPPPPFDLTYEDRDLLKTVSQHVATQIAQHEADRKLAESRQFEAYNKLTAFMMHDLKNSVAQLQLIVANSDRHKRNPEFVDDVIATIANAVARMNGLIEQLRGGGEAAVRVAALNEILAAAVHHCNDRAPRASMELPGEAIWVRADTDRLCAVIEHVVRNAQDATSEGGTVHCVLTRAGAVASLTIEDNGGGMAPEFVRERLFRPFDSTKGAKGMGIGAYQVREYVRMLGGDVEVQSSPGKGTRFSISLPVSSAPELHQAASGLAGEQVQA